jgi:hypothetical protein
MLVILLVLQRYLKRRGRPKSPTFISSATPQEKKKPAQGAGKDFRGDKHEIEAILLPSLQETLI